ncbi:MAG: Holliday junction branch migration protein RuvA [Candidatus Nanopelagicales bacterium]
MIASLSGTIIHSGTERLVVEVGGVGLAVTTSAATCAAVSAGQHVSLATTLVVREDSLTLFGFLESSDRDVFEILQSVSGFGPRIALAALSAYSADQLRGIVARGDEAALTKVSGIGKKGAQRLILELADKLGPPTNESAGGARASSHGLSHDTWQTQVRDALVGLGWSNREAEEAVTVAEAEYPDKSAAAVSEMLALVLRGMSQR